MADPLLDVVYPFVDDSVMDDLFVGSPFLSLLRILSPRTNRELAHSRQLTLGLSGDRATEVVNKMIEEGLINDPDTPFKQKKDNGR